MNKRDYKTILFLAIPILLNGIVLQLQAIIGRAFLGNLGTHYLSVIGNTSFPFFASISIPLSVTMGLTILVAQSIGADNRNKAKEYVESAFIFNVLIASGIFIIWKLFAKNIFQMMGITDTGMLELCINFINIQALAIPLIVLEMTIVSILQGVGKTKPIMYNGIIKVILNILLDFGLIFGSFGMPKYGYLGAAIAFVISGLFSVCFLTYVFIRTELPFNIELRNILKINWKPYKDVLNVGLPSGFELFAWYIASLFRIDFINSTGSYNVAVFTIIYGIELFIYQIYDSLGKATTTIVGQKVGAGEDNEIRDTLKTVNIINLFTTITVILLSIIFAHQILGIFTNDNNLIEYSVLFLLINVFISIPRSLNVIYGAGIRAMGDTKWMFYTQMIGTIVIITLSYVSIFWLGIGFVGIFIAAFFDEILRAVINTARFYYGRNIFSVKNLDFFIEHKVATICGIIVVFLLVKSATGFIAENVHNSDSLLTSNSTAITTTPTTTITPIHHTPTTTIAPTHTKTPEVTPNVTPNLIKKSIYYPSYLNGFALKTNNLNKGYSATYIKGTESITVHSETLKSVNTKETIGKINNQKIYYSNKTKQSFWFPSGFSTGNDNYCVVINFNKSKLSMQNIKKIASSLRILNK